MDIAILTQDYELQGFLSNPVAVIYTEGYCSLGNFQLNLPLDSTNTTLVQEERIVLFDMDKGIAGIIGVVQKTISSKGVPELTVKGNLLEEFLFRRICWGLYTKSGFPSDIAYDMVEKHVTAPTIAARAIPDIVALDADKAVQLGVKTTLQDTGGVVGDNLIALCSPDSLGFRLRLELPNKRMVFKVYKGTDRTVNQTEVAPCLFSYIFENMLESKYNLNTQDSRNVALIAGEGEGIERTYTTVGEVSGKSRKEIFVDARDLQSTDNNGMAMTAEEYLEVLKQRGSEKLAECRRVESFDGTINTQGNIRYGVDYFLGDKVTVFDSQLGIQLDAIITEAEHSYSSKGESLNLTFGFGPLTLTQKLKVRMM